MLSMLIPGGDNPSEFRVSSIVDANPESPTGFFHLLAIEHDPHRAGPAIHLDPPAGTRVWLAQTCQGSSTGREVVLLRW